MGGSSLRPCRLWFQWLQEGPSRNAFVGRKSSIFQICHFELRTSVEGPWSRNKSITSERLGLGERGWISQTQNGTHAPGSRFQVIFWLFSSGFRVDLGSTLSRDSRSTRKRPKRDSKSTPKEGDRWWGWISRGLGCSWQAMSLLQRKKTI